MGRVVNLLGRGGQRFAEQTLGWNRQTLRKGQQELHRGQSIQDRFHERGRRRAEERLPQLLDDIRAIIVSGHLHLEVRRQYPDRK